MHETFYVIVHSKTKELWNGEKWVPEFYRAELYTAQEIGLPDTKIPEEGTILSTAEYHNTASIERV